MKLILLIMIICFSLGTRGIFGAELVGHEAFYTLDIVKSSNSADRLSDFRGMLVIDREKTCDGWISNENLKMQIKFKSGRTILRDIQYSGWESLKIFFYRFGTKENSQLNNFNIRGSANVDNGIGQIKFLIPKKKPIMIPLNTKFPVGFTGWLIKQIKSGKTKLSSYFFDGTDSEGPELVDVVVGGEIKGSSYTNLRDKTLTRSKGWKMRFLVKPYKVNKERLSYSYDAVILENGVLLNTEFDFEGLKVRQEIKAFNKFSDPEC